MTFAELRARAAAIGQILERVNGSFRMGSGAVGEWIRYAALQPIDHALTRMETSIAAGDPPLPSAIPSPEESRIVQGPPLMAGALRSGSGPVDALLQNAAVFLGKKLTDDERRAIRRFAAGLGGKPVGSGLPFPPPSLRKWFATPEAQRIVGPFVRETQDVRTFAELRAIATEQGLFLERVNGSFRMASQDQIWTRYAALPQVEQDLMLPYANMSPSGREELISKIVAKAKTAQPPDRPSLTVQEAQLTTGTQAPSPTEQEESISEPFVWRTKIGLEERMRRHRFVPDEWADITEIAGDRIQMVLRLRDQIMTWHVEQKDFDKNTPGWDNIIERSWLTFQDALRQHLPNIDDLTPEQERAIVNSVFPTGISDVIDEGKKEIVYSPDELHKAALDIKRDPSLEGTHVAATKLANQYTEKQLIELADDFSGVSRVRDAVGQTADTSKEFLLSADDPALAWKLIVEIQETATTPVALHKLRRYEKAAIALWEQLADNPSAPYEIQNSSFRDFGLDMLIPKILENGTIPVLEEAPLVSSTQMVFNALQRAGLLPVNPSDDYRDRIREAAGELQVADFVFTASGGDEGRAPTVAEKLQQIIADSPWTEVWAASVAEAKRVKTQAGQAQLFGDALESALMSQGKMPDKPSEAFIREMARQLPYIQEQFKIAQARAEAAGEDELDLEEFMEGYVRDFPDEETLRLRQTDMRVRFNTVSEKQPPVAGVEPDDEDILLTRAFDIAVQRYDSAIAGGEDVTFEAIAEEEIEKARADLALIPGQVQERFGPTPPGTGPNVFEVGQPLTEEMVQSLQAFSRTAGFPTSTGDPLDVIAGQGILDVERREREGAIALLESEAGPPLMEESPDLIERIEGQQVSVSPTFTEEQIQEATARLKEGFGQEDSLYGQFVAGKISESQAVRGLEQTPSGRRQSQETSLRFAKEAFNRQQAAAREARLRAQQEATQPPAEQEKTPRQRGRRVIT